MRPRALVCAAALFAFIAFPSTSIAGSVPELRVSPSTATPGGSVSVQIDGFGPGRPVDVFLDRTDVMVVRTDDAGHVKAPIAIPSTLVPGRHWVSAKARGADAFAQRPITVFAPPADRSQEGSDIGRTGAASDETVLTRTSVDSLREVWWRDLAVLEPGEQVFVTDAAGEIAEPTAVGRGAIVATWFGNVIDRGYRESSRTRLAVLDLNTGMVLWDLRTDAAKGWSASRPVILGGVVVVRWSNDRVLLGLGLTDGSERWRQTLSGRDRFGEPLVLDGRVLIPVDRPRGSDGVRVVDASGGAVATWDIGPGSNWRLLASGDTVVAIGASSIVALDRSDGSLRWTARSAAWWGASAASGDVLVAPAATGVATFDLRDGDRRWTWQAWSSPSSLASVAGAGDGVVYVRSSMMVCAPGGSPEECPYRVRLSALDLASGHERWFRQGTFTYTAALASPIPGPVAVTDEVLVGPEGATDVQDGELIRPFAAPVRPDTFGAQHAWYGRPIVTGGRVVMGAADGTITMFAALVDLKRPLPSVLVVDRSLSPPPATPAPTVEPTTSPAPLRAEPAYVWVWVLVVVLLGVAAVGAVAIILRRRVRAGRHGLDLRPGADDAAGGAIRGAPKARQDR
jgi:PQQ-like domain